MMLDCTGMAHSTEHSVKHFPSTLVTLPSWYAFYGFLLPTLPVVRGCDLVLCTAASANGSRWVYLNRDAFDAVLAKHHSVPQ